MSITVLQSKKALSPGRSASFSGTGGVAPYSYSVSPNGAGGSIDASTGVYLSPASLNLDPKFSEDTIIVTDDSGDESTATILVTNALGLFCEILERELGLARGRVYLWNQKINQPTDAGLYIAVSVMSDRPLSNVNRPNSDGIGVDSEQFTTVMSTIGIDVISRGSEARDKRFDVILALNSTYAQQQQEANGFYISKLPVGARFANLSIVDGAAIPYRFHIDVNIQYAYSKNTAVPYFDQFSNDTIVNS